MRGERSGLPGPELPEMSPAAGAAGDDHLADIRRHEAVEPAHPALHQTLRPNGEPTLLL